MRFFDDQRMDDKPFSQPRAIVGSAERLKLGKGADQVEKRATSAWQTAAWQYLDSIGEVHFAFNLIGQVMSRVRLYAAIIEDPDQPPVRASDYLEALKEKTENDAPQTAKVVDEANKLVDDMASRAQGGISGLLRSFAINLSVPGEAYLLNHKDKWIVASTDELNQKGDKTYYKRTRTASSRRGKANNGEEQLADDAFVARIWRSHPRYSSEPDSSMIGVLDDCEQLVLLNQALRSMTRSRMTAGIMFIPDGLTSFSSETEADDVETAITRATMQAVEDESSQYTVAPLILKGPKELGEGIKWIPFGRQLDEPFLTLLDRSLDRVLQGLDIPKDIVTGLANVRYSSAVVIDENLYRAHVEPLVLLIVDALTNVYLRPQLRKLTGTADDNTSALVNRMVIWADTSAVVTRADKSTAANEGYDRKILSEAAWRDARGFADNDAPDPEELLRRVVIDRGTLSPEISDLLLKRIEPEFFETARGEASQLPPDIESLLNEEVSIPPADEAQSAIEVPDDASSLDSAMSGGEINPNGNLPPRP